MLRICLYRAKSCALYPSANRKMVVGVQMPTADEVRAGAAGPGSAVEAASTMRALTTGRAHKIGMIPSLAMGVRYVLHVVLLDDINVSPEIEPQLWRLGTLPPNPCAVHLVLQ